MLSEVIAFLSGSVFAGITGVLVTAGHYRSSEAVEVRRAVAKLKRHLEFETDSGLGDLGPQLKDLCKIIDNAEDCVVRSPWAQRHRNAFLVGCEDVMQARLEGTIEENRRIVIEGRELIKDSGEMLLGFLHFPSWLWCKATFYRLISPVVSRGKL